jgi:hypothetical protein
MRILLVLQDAKTPHPQLFMQPLMSRWFVIFQKAVKRPPGVRAVFNVAGLVGEMGEDDWFIADYVVAVIGF